MSWIWAKTSAPPAWPHASEQENAMSEPIKADKEMDLKGLACPMPIVKVSKGIKEIAVGQILRAVTTDPGALTDFPAWAKTSGNEIVGTVTEGKETSFFIKRLV
jgi:tRNA 2-thiouridine synthesizing protein A